jgi:glycosyltransferase involved in cell wall biosynthesis
MNVFLLTSDVPFRRDDAPGVSAVNIVAGELIRALVAGGHRVALQVIFNVYRRHSGLTEWELAEWRAMEALGVHLFPAVYPAEYASADGGPLVRSITARARRLLAPPATLADFYPAVRLESVRARIRDSGSDAILTIWSPEGLAAAFGVAAIPKVAYHGDIDFGPADARTADPDLFEAPRDANPVRRGLGRHLQRRALQRWRSAHFTLMQSADVIANVTASNAAFYTAGGHRRSVYIGNTWSDCRPVRPEPTRSADRQPIKILGHIGSLSPTGSTYGLRFLLADVMPALDEVMRDLPYDVHVIGGGGLVPALRPLATHPRLVMRGFVPDLEPDLRSADVYLLLNNAGSYRAAFTRHIVAWSMGLCLIVHANSCDAIPEIRHMDNALVGTSGREVAELIRAAATDGELNARIRAGGRRTYEAHFTPERIAASLIAEMKTAQTNNMVRTA